ncbi:energy transducer TonB [Flavobacterium sp. ASV13]|uniref:energy transducer TonB n=1 Tax=Flavobacterium sp. ASV13 TaxID=1506583 RepID=UPI0005539326|nr:energy transducer TonB [Flavobacterium sp. ASV13]
MKAILRVLFFLFISTKLVSQNALPANKIIYLDSTWAETTADNYHYIRLIEKYYSDEKSYVFKDYYKSEKLKAIGHTLDKDILKRDGQFISYYENGKKKSTVTYVNNKKTGREFNWYENGDIKSEFEYFELKDKTTDYKINNFWNTQKEHTVIDGNGDYTYKDEYSEESGKLKNGQPDGIWTGKHFKKKLSFSENYENGKLVSGITKDSLNIEHPYTEIRQQPAPKKGINSFYSYVGKSMNIPVEARNTVYGKIFLTFIVDEEGNLVEPKILKGLGYGLDENAIKIIKEAKKWNPGIYRGIPVRVLYSLPITIAKKS